MNPSSLTLSSTFSNKKNRDQFDDDPKNDVFINYSFEDIGKTFISHLKGALKHSGFTISDHTMLPVGQDIHLQLLKAIEESEIYVLVFSSNYASSIRCLDELVDIMDHHFCKPVERKVVPVFFKVEPSDVRSQHGPFMEAFQAHETNVSQERVQEWRKALKDAGHLSGFTLQNGDEAKFVSDIVEELEKMQRPHKLFVTDHHPVGLKSRAKELISTLRLNQKDIVLVVAVLGIGGIGKTTIVKEAYNRIAPSFDLSCFLEDIHSICQSKNWKVKFPTKLISCLTRDNKFSFMGNHNHGVTLIRKLVKGRKVLLVLDDVDNFQQLELVGICPEYFYKGSRIIVTTRDKRSLGNIPFEPYHTRLLNRSESLNLFTRLMFSRDDPVSTKLLEKVVGCAGGHPLVLMVWSRHFKQFETEQWACILEKLKGIPHDDVQKQLQVSYDSLPSKAKKLFLDIACFFFDNDFRGQDLDYKDLVVKLLLDEDSRYFPNVELQYLVDKGLVEIRSDNRLWMHRAIMEMGQEVVRQENEDEPGQRTRLVDEMDAERVLSDCLGTKSVESIIGFIRNVQKATDLEAFRTMSNLRLLHLYTHEGSVSHDEMTPLCFKKLKGMFWYGFPFKSFDIIDMCNVTILCIQQCKLETLWDGIKSLKKLKILTVRFTDSLTRTGDFFGLENLEELCLEKCINLKELHGSIGSLQKLVVLDLRASIPIKSIPWEMIGKLPSLQKLLVGDSEHNKYVERDEVNDTLLYSLKACPITTLKLHNCNILGGLVNLSFLKHLLLFRSEIRSHPDILLQLYALDTLVLDYCAAMQSIPNLPPNLTSLKVRSCYGLVNLPCNISELKYLTVLHFDSCDKLGTEDPDFLMKITGLTNLTHLTMIDCGVSRVPSEIGNLVSLKELDFSQNMYTLCSLPDTLSNLSQLLVLNIYQCYKLQLLPLLPSNLTYINAIYCESLDLMSSASLRTQVCKESPFSNGFCMHLWVGKEEVPKWCSYQNMGDVLSFVAPVNHLQLDNKICGIFLCANTSKYVRDDSLISKIYNKTKNTSHRLVTKQSVHSGVYNTIKYHTRVMSYPLDDTTLVVEPGDSVVIQFPKGFISSCGLRLIYDSDVVDGKLVL